MLQLQQSLSTGTTIVATVPAPRCQPGHLLIESAFTLVSAGTERMLLEFGRANWLDKARQQPDKVRQVLQKVGTDGLAATVAAVRSKLDQPMAAGYCNVGRVLEMGEGVSDFRVGDLVASNGKHAEIVSVPVNLCAKVPDAVPAEAAAFTVLGAIALQGIRLAAPTLGESVVVTGLGLVGQLTIQLLRAQGCRVLGLDIDRRRCELARHFGAQTLCLAEGGDPVAAATEFSRGRGVDAVLITASTNSNEPVSQAAQMCRKRGRIVLVGVTGLQLSRADFYEKELSFQVSCSYGPGRYDPDYEDRGRDYPVGFVRWTEQRNFEAVLDMMADGRLDTAPLVTHQFPIEEAARAYDVMGGAEPSLGILLRYPPDDAARARKLERTVVLRRAAADALSGPLTRPPRLGVFGAGNYGTQVLLPALTKAGAHLLSVASNAGLSGLHAARKFGADETTTDPAALLRRDDLDAVVVATRHDSHARYVCQALASGRSVFVEKPMVLRADELDDVQAAWSAARERDPRLFVMVGFNRRFAPHVVEAARLLAPLTEPRCMVMTVNAGAIPMQHWTQDLDAGGGRLIGEGCHFVDLLRFLAGAPITAFDITSIGRPVAGTVTDKFTLTLRFADGSIGTVHYFANGHRAFPKERLEVFCAGRVLQIDNFRRMSAHGWPDFRRLNLWRQDKGQRGCAAAFVEAVRARSESPIPFDEIVEVSRVCIEAAHRLGQ